MTSPTVRTCTNELIIDRSVNKSLESRATPPGVILAGALP